jgi:hypothetical protein
LYIKQHSLEGDHYLEYLVVYLLLLVIAGLLRCTASKYEYQGSLAAFMGIYAHSTASVGKEKD